MSVPPNTLVVGFKGSNYVREYDWSEWGIFEAACDFATREEGPDGPGDLTVTVRSDKASWTVPLQRVPATYKVAPHKLPEEFRNP